MNILIAMDSFKGSLSSIEAGNAAAEGIRRAFQAANSKSKTNGKTSNDINIQVCPLADGGEGTTEALTYGMGGSLEQVIVKGPREKEVICTYGIIEDKHTAIMEMASASGITLISEEERNPLYTTTYGFGEAINDAIDKGCRNFLIGIGGSATNDGGVGMLQALGFSFLDKQGVEIPRGAAGLEKLDRIEIENVRPELKECTFQIACDVINPLCGENGCSAVFGPQKGADATMIQQMNQWLGNYARIAKTINPGSDGTRLGSGAAGGMGFAFQTFLNGKLESGVKLVLDQTGLKDKMKDADWVITGEGRLDGQTVMGKAPIGVAKLAKEQGKPVIAFGGSVDRSASVCNEAGIDAFFPIVRGVSSLEEAMNSENAAKNLADTCEQVFRLIVL